MGRTPWHRTEREDDDDRVVAESMVRADVVELARPALPDAVRRRAGADVVRPAARPGDAGPDARRADRGARHPAPGVAARGRPRGGRGRRRRRRRAARPVARRGVRRPGLRAVARRGPRRRPAGRGADRRAADRGLRAPGRRHRARRQPAGRAGPAVEAGARCRGPPSDPARRWSRPRSWSPPPAFADANVVAISAGQRRRPDVRDHDPGLRQRLPVGQGRARRHLRLLRDRAARLAAQPRRRDRQGLLLRARQRGQEQPGLPAVRRVPGLRHRELGERRHDDVRPAPGRPQLVVPGATFKAYDRAGNVRTIDCRRSPAA